LLQAERENSSLQKELSGALERGTAQVMESQKKMKDTAAQLKASQLKIRQLQRQCEHAATVQEKAVKRAEEQGKTHSLLHKGVYTEETRCLIWLIVQLGCPMAQVGKVIHAVLKAAGISAKGDVTARTVGRVMQEGLYIAKIQLGHEMQLAQSRCIFIIA